MELGGDQLLKLGHVVKIPELALEVPQEFGSGKKVYFGKYIEEKGGMDAFPVGHKIWNLKEGAIRDHYEKIDWADAILVVNQEKRGIEVFLGENNIFKIGFSFYLKNPFFFLPRVYPSTPRFS